MIGLPQLLIASLFAVCAAGLGGFAYGNAVGRTAEIAAQKRVNDVREAARQQLQSQIDASATVAQAEEYRRQKSVREINRDTAQILEKPVYRNICIDDDGIRLLDRARTAANGNDIAAPASPATAAASGSARR